jgi:hypothetical protein
MIKVKKIDELKYLLTDFRNESFDVKGAGILQFSNSCDIQCGGEVGFHIGTSWGKYRLFGGGVISRKEAKRLADHIYKQLNNTTKSELDIKLEWNKRNKINF